MGGATPTSPSVSTTAVEAYFIPGWTTVVAMPTYSVNMGQSVGVYSSDLMFVVAGAYTPATGMPAMKYTASTDSWAYGTLAPHDISVIVRSVRIPPVCTRLQ